jgi:UDP-glucuronate decarboxylase
MRILVTGGAGFIGSHLIDRLMSSGHQVICLDNFYTGRKHNVLHWLNSSNFELIRHDVTDPVRLEVDQIYHLACPASPVHYQYNPVKTIKTNVMGTLHLLGLAKRVKARFLLASTSEVYGDPEVHPQAEDYRGCVNPIGPRSCYDEGKRVAETLSFDYHRQNNVDIRVARIFNTYGPRMLENDGRVVSNFIVQALRGDAITVYGDGSQTRSFCYVDDLVDGLMRLMNGDCIGPVNLGNPDEYTVLQLAQKIQGMVNPNAEIQFKSLPQDDPRRRQPDITLAKQALGWQPTIALEDGLQKTIEDFSSRAKASLPIPSAPYIEV